MRKDFIYNIRRSSVGNSRQIITQTFFLQNSVWVEKVEDFFTVSSVVNVISTVYRRIKGVKVVW